MSEHTPGPWTSEFQGNSTWDILCSSDILTHERRSEIVAIIEDRFGDNPRNEHKANARLIAAAPDLLAACKALVEAMHRYEMDVDGDPTHAHRDMMNLANAAIAKAEAKSARKETP
jgi:hypothetical protein